MTSCLRSFIPGVFLTMVGLLSLAVSGEAFAQLDPGDGGDIGFNNVGGVAIDAQGTIADLRPQVRQDIASKRDQLASEVQIGRAHV